MQDSIEIRATPDQVLDVILDLEAYPEWAEGMKDATVLQRDDAGRPVQCRFVVDARVVQIDYVLQYDHSGPHLTWTLAEGDEILRQLDGEYRLAERDGATDVTYALEVDVTIPVPAFLKNRAARSILETSLRGLRDRVQNRA